MQDLEALAAHYGMGIDDAIARFAWNDNFSMAVDQIRQRFPAEFAGASIESASSAWVSFAGRPPSEALAVLEEFGLSSPGLAVDLEVVANRGFTESKLDEAVQSVHYALMASPLVLSASSGYDIQTGLVSSQVILAEGVDESRVRELQDLGTSQLAAPIEAVVSVAPTSALGGVEAGADWHYGGEDITLCTSGFTAKTSSGSRRVVTAGHCGAQSDDGDPLPFSAEYSGTHGDFQSHTGTEPIYDNFYAGNATTLEVNARDVAAIGAPTVGMGLCKNGEETKAGCSTVLKLGHCADAICNLVLMEDHITDGGDSGGPWYFGYTAYGIHYGWDYEPFWPFDRSAFSRADRLDNALFITVATS